MDKMIYTAALGASRIMQAQSIRANNLANADTAGFKADLERVASMKVQTVPDALPTRVMAYTEENGFSNRHGVANPTGRPLDVAIRGDGFFTVQTDDGEAYTRNGALVADAEGQLTIDGHPVMGDGGPIVLPPYQEVSVSSDGTISIKPSANAPMQEVGQLKLVQPAFRDMHKGLDGLFRPKVGGQLAANDEVHVDSGVLESSNVNAVNELIASMVLSRQFEVQVKLMKTAERLAEAGNSLLREA